MKETHVTAPEDSMSMLIKGGRVVDPGRHLDSIGSVLVKDRRITWVGVGVPSLEPDCQVIDAHGMVVCPGFIDLHCHLREPGFEEKETIATGTRAAARGGFTTICCMPNTNPAIDSVETVRFVQAKSRCEGLVRVLPIACISRARRGRELVDMKELVEAGVVGFSDDGDCVKSDDIMRQALVTGKELNVPIIDHCEDPIGGDSDGEVKMVARDLSLAEKTGGWVHIAHVSAAGSIALINSARKQGVRVTAEATPHHLTLTGDEVASRGALAKVNPPLRSEGDRVAVAKALKEGVIDVIATDHAPHTLEDKEKTFSAAAAGISGFETAFGAVMGLVHSGELTLLDAIYRLTAAPAKLVHRRYGHIGSLGVGAEADIVVIAPDREWTVDAHGFASKGRNTPLDGRRLKGKVTATIAEGRLVYLDESMKSMILRRSAVGEDE